MDFLGQSLSCYFLYTVGGVIPLASRWSKTAVVSDFMEGFEYSPPGSVVRSVTYNSRRGSPSPGFASFERQSYRDCQSNMSRGSPSHSSTLSSFLEPAFRWWYLPALFILFLLYLSAKLAYEHPTIQPKALEKVADAIHSSYRSMLKERRGEDDSTFKSSGAKQEVHSPTPSGPNAVILSIETARELTIMAPDDEIDKERLRTLARQVLREELEDEEMGPDYANYYTGALIHKASGTANYGSTISIPLLFFAKREPELVIEKPDRHIIPGKCWPMQGTEGHVIIKLSSSIRPSFVSYEHAPRRLLRPEDMLSFPKTIEISAGEDLQHLHPWASHKFDGVPERGPTLIRSVAENGKKVRFIKFAVSENFGEPRFTCLYRIRVFAEDANKGKE